MTTSNTATRAVAHYARARQVAEDQLREADRLAFGLTRLPHLIAAAEYFGKAWGVADLMSTTCPAKEFRTWAERREYALAGCHNANAAITELIRLEVAG